MTRSTGFVLLGAAILFFVACAALIVWRLAPTRPAKVVAPAIPPVETAAPEAKPITKASPIIDLPGDPVLVHRGATLAPRALQLIAPGVLTATAPKAEVAAFFVSTPLISTDGFMGKFPEAGQEADAITAQIALASPESAP